MAKLSFKPAAALPKALCPQQFHCRIVGDECCALNDRLCGERAIKMIAMGVVEATRLERVLVGEGKMDEAVCDDEFVELADGRFGAR